MKLAALN